MSTDMSAAPLRKKQSFPRSPKPSVRMCVQEQRSILTMLSPDLCCWPVPMRAIGAQNLLTMPGGVSIAGYLHKKGGSQFSLKKWPLRYIIIHRGCIYYFKSSTSQSPQGAFSLNGYNRVMRAAEETTSSNVFPFKIIHFSKKHRTWFLSAASEDERRKWMRFLRREIDHYNDRKEAQIPSDSDSDADSFYGTIEKPMDIHHTVDNTEDDYIEEDDEDEEDYVKPDSDSESTSTGKPTGPPPSYPPPPVPAPFQLHQDASPVFHRGLPPPVPSHNKTATSSLPKKPPSPHAPASIQDFSNKGPPPPLPFAPHLKNSSPTPPPPPPPNAKRLLKSRGSTVSESGITKKDQRSLPAIFVQSPATLPICNQLETRMVLNGPAHCSLNQDETINHRSKFGSLMPPDDGGPNHGPRPGISTPLAKPQTPPNNPPPSPAPITGFYNKPLIPKPPSPAFKPELPAAKSKLLQAPPEGQSFRSPGEEKPADTKMKQALLKHFKEDDSDDDYENVQLPDSVFIDTTETCFIEKLFRECSATPQDGLYAIRNSGTKTSKVLVVLDVSIGKARNYRLFEEGGHIFLDSDVTFPTLSALIEHYHSHPLPHHCTLCLQRPYTKMLNN
ncbi:SH3 domain-binding protein 2 isoform X2 [Thalassophryne amazonica]|uniref:SH3 domain-binding protein 2 isoform X2 n=1 Tax=Thalassophryne amazonica TaxID=390379 RepID=UPI0014716AD5|nr:SH3 domain-binding protein 2 isoform X2 [Thalassophryne amazonica]